MSWERYSAQMLCSVGCAPQTDVASASSMDRSHPATTAQQNMPQQECPALGCSRSGCTGARLVTDNAAFLEAEYLQQQHNYQASQKPYRVGLILLCMGALFNWLGLAQAYVEPMRYIGVGCIVAGALLICAAMCRWLGRSSAGTAGQHATDLSSCELNTIGREEGSSLYGGQPPSVHIISLPLSPTLQSKPPDYESLVCELPTYEDAIKLRPTLELVQQQPLVANEDSVGPSSDASTTRVNLTKAVESSLNDSPAHHSS
ncbi:Hypothetical predicted protein [Cloeon dipterum]|uniref:Uncharacterized protein n=1 Tax=Cloeon dipterum TaxID=197152 RepID=A0A8S1BVX4_9INSE|nr:Hypothetical predicted protein [Cloeon dipterum]